MEMTYNRGTMAIANKGTTLPNNAEMDSRDKEMTYQQQQQQLQATSTSHSHHPSAAEEAVP